MSFVSYIPFTRAWTDRRLSKRIEQQLAVYHQRLRQDPKGIDLHCDDCKSR